LFEAAWRSGLFFVDFHDHPSMAMTARQIQELLVERWNTGELDRVFDLFDQDIVVRLDPEHPDRVCFGTEAAKRFWESQREIMGPGHLEIEQLHEMGDRCLTRIYQPVLSRSGVRTGYSWSQIITCRNGKVVLSEFFIDHALALEALGLEDSLRGSA
jgi:ketosteroid isomerase-like protein